MKALLLTLALITGAAMPALAQSQDTTEVVADGTKIETTGILRHVMAIGGETTGTMLLGADGSYEIDLRHVRGSMNLPEGTRLQVRGVITTVYGVETGARKVLVVTKAEAI